MTNQDDKKRLLEHLENAISPLSFSANEKEDIRNAFTISFEGHRHAPRRATGEIYFMHVFRQCLEMIHLMKRFKVRSSDLLATILLHDVIEDAEKGQTTDFMMRSQIHLQVNDRVVYYVMCMTKKKNKESRVDFLRRLEVCDVWQVIVAKHGDANDNIRTLAATPQATQAIKVREIFTHYPILRRRGRHLIVQEGKSGHLKNWRRWLRLLDTMYATLIKNAHTEESRLVSLGIYVA
jgi:hypothetical protein